MTWRDFANFIVTLRDCSEEGQCSPEVYEQILQAMEDDLKASGVPGFNHGCPHKRIKTRNRLRVQRLLRALPMAPEHAIQNLQRRMTWKGGDLLIDPRDLPF